MKKFLCILALLASVSLYAFGAMACNEGNNNDANNTNNGSQEIPSNETPDLGGWGDL